MTHALHKYFINHNKIASEVNSFRDTICLMDMSTDYVSHGKQEYIESNIHAAKREQ